MKKLRIVVAVLLTAGTFQCYAQQHTNLVQNLNIQLYGLKQGNTTTNFNFVSTGVDVVRVNTRQVIQALASVTGASISSTSRLVLVTPLNGMPTSVQIRDGANVLADVSAFFEIQPLTASVQGVQSNLRSGRTIQTDYYIQHFALKDMDGVAPLTLHFSVSGFAVGSSTPSNPNRPGADVSTDVSGSGDSNGNLIIIQGSVGVLGHATEVVDDVIWTTT